MISTDPKIIKFEYIPIIKKVSGRNYRAMQELVSKIQPLMRRNLAGGLKEFQEGASLYDIENFIATGQWNRINSEVIRWKELDPVLRKTLEKDFNNAILKSADLEKEFFRQAVRKIIPALDEVPLPFSLQNPRILRWKEARLTFLRTRMEQTGYNVIDDVIRLNFNRGMTPRALSRLIRGSIGLNQPQARALSNYRAGLEEQGIAGNKLEQMVGGYSDKLIKSRADTIAWTETTGAVNHGQMEVWRQAEEADLVDLDKTTKTWIAMDDEIMCEICGELNGTTVKMNEQFYSEALGEYFDGAPSHINCRCMLDIGFLD